MSSMDDVNSSRPAELNAFWMWTHRRLIRFGATTGGAVKS
jgi:hypothetical protein